MFARFLLAWLVISGVAAYDTYLTVKHAEVMREVELNPIACFIIQASGGVALIVALKTAGVALALLLSFAAWQRESFRRKMLKCSLFVAAFQLVLLGYLLTEFDYQRRAIPKPTINATKTDLSQIQVVSYKTAAHR